MGFSDGSKLRTDRIAGFHRLEDWAILVADTGIRPALARATKPPSIGERLLVFNIEAGNTRTIGGVDFTGRNHRDQTGERLAISPSPTRESAGGPRMNSWGEAVGLVGGTILPGARASTNGMIPVGLWNLVNAVSATPVSSVKANAVRTVAEMAKAGELTPPLEHHPKLTKEAHPRSDILGSVTGAHEFSRRDPKLVIYTNWLFDSANVSFGQSKPVRVKPGKQKPAVAIVTFDTEGLKANSYRVDLLLNGRTIWRSFFQFTH